ncbi:Alpha/Beta hydrolase protein [Mycena haematopus]|nr:Alpha/Beta hydrolase protein [Mycena haematopus]
MAETLFKISVSEEQLAGLKHKLELTRFPDELDDAGWAYGAPLSDIKRLVSRWTNGYDWRKHEALLNAELPQFTRDIPVDGFGALNVHYIHKRSALETAIPLLFVHGWPGSFLEARKIAPLLTQVLPDQPTFHLVAVSLPGYGFSEAPKKKGFRLAQYAELCNKLMLALGYEEYVTQGGDWGSMITRKIATLYGGKHAKAWHTNFPIVGPKFSWNPLHLLSLIWLLLPLLWLPAAEKAGLQRAQEVERTGMGYFAEQSTKPQTLGYALADSPAGLLAWIYEKLVAWTDRYPWDDDEVLTWISLYWFSRAGPAASLRIYYEVVAEGGVVPAPYGAHPTIPFGISYFPGELVGGLPRSWARRTGNVVFSAEHELGGHFAAHEVPELLVGDLQRMFGRGGPAYGVVTGCDGYWEMKMKTDLE